MHRSLVIALLGASLVVAGVVTADAGPAQGTLKIGFINLESTLLTTPTGKRAQQQFEQALKKKQQELDGLQKKFQEDLAQLEKQKSVLKPEAFQKRQQELEKAYVEVQQLYVKLERDLAAERAKLIQEILKKAEPVIIEVAKQKGIDVIFDRQAVLWSSDGFDLTNEVNSRMK